MRAMRLCLSKARIKWLHPVWTHLHDISEKGKNYSDRKSQRCYQGLGTEGGTDYRGTRGAPGGSET